ncbi:MAG: serine protease [Bacteroidetes bacterium]|nr:serine protease [Bacteroidota bacterium]
MPHNLSISEQLAYNTVRIECDLTSGGSGTGTGYFYRFELSNNIMVPVIVTNKHVIDDVKQMRFILTLSNANDEPMPQSHFGFYIDDVEKNWIKHTDSEIDLCIMPIQPLLTQAAQINKKFFFISLEKSLIPTQQELDDMTALEDIIMVGYPNGIWDKVNNLPILRKGITASHPNFDWNGKPEFMIDAACFPGSSGSPVLLFNQGGYSTKSGGMIIGPSRIKLLGTLYAGPQHTIAGDVKIINVPTQQKPIAISTIPNNLGIVIKSKVLSDFLPILQNLVNQSGS